MHHDPDTQSEPSTGSSIGSTAAYTFFVSALLFPALFILLPVVVVVSLIVIFWVAILDNDKTSEPTKTSNLIDENFLENEVTEPIDHDETNERIAS